MNREDILKTSLEKIMQNKCLLLELATGVGKSKISIDLVNHVCRTEYSDKQTSMLLLVAKKVHKQTWKDEFTKWGGILCDKVVIECYESLKKHVGEHFTFVVMDEFHHLGSEAKTELFSLVDWEYSIGLSATIPMKLKSFFKYTYKASVISCDISEAIDSKVLPEPRFLLFPLTLDNTNLSETIELHPKAKGPVHTGEFKELWQWKKRNLHVLIRCTQQQKLREMDSNISWEKNKYMMTRIPALEQRWLFHCGQRLEYLADIKMPIIKRILTCLKDQRTITFCKTIQQCEQIGDYCIHSQNPKATEIYDAFNRKEINHITAVNILNENANLVDCKYAVFCNLSSSSVVVPQRIGRSMRHKEPVIIVPYYKYTREEELVNKMFEGYRKEFISTISNENEIFNY